MQTIGEVPMIPHRLGVFKSRANLWAKTFASPAEFDDYHATVGCALEGFLLFNEHGELLRAGGTAVRLEIVRPASPPSPK